MPTPLKTAAEVIEAVRWLENQPGERAMRDRTKRWHDLATLTDVADLPEHVSRGDTRDTPSPFLSELLDDIQSERHAGATSVTIIGIGDDPQTTVDRVERWASMVVGKALRAWRVIDEGGFHQCISYAGILETCYEGADAEGCATSVQCPNPLSTFFSAQAGPFRPPMVAQRYEALVADIERNYADIRGMLSTEGYRPALDANGRWKWQQLSDDREAWSGGTGMYSSRFGSVCELLKFDDSYFTYHVAMARGTSDGFLLWTDENRAGPDENGQPASGTIVVPGKSTGFREPKYRYQPVLFPGIQYTLLLNYITSLMATRVEQATGDVLVEKTPDMMEAMANTPQLVASAAQLQRGNPNIIEVAGKPMLWERLPLPDLIELLNFFRQERDSWANSLREISNPEQLAQINTNVYLPHAAARRRKLAPMNDNMDWALAQVVRIAFWQLQYANAKKARMVATGDERYGMTMSPMEPGDAATVSWDDVKDFDKRYQLHVTTSTVTDAELYQQVLEHDDLVARGYKTKRQGIGIMFPAEQKQVDVLAQDEAKKAATQLLMPQVPTTVQKKIRLRGGMLISLGGVVPPPTTTGGNVGNQPYPTPVVPGTQSSSAAGVPPGAAAPVAAGA